MQSRPNEREREREREREILYACQKNNQLCSYRLHYILYLNSFFLDLMYLEIKQVMRKHPLLHTYRNTDTSSVQFDQHSYCSCTSRSFTYFYHIISTLKLCWTFRVVRHFSDPKCPTFFSSYIIDFCSFFSRYFAFDLFEKAIGMQ